MAKTFCCGIIGVFVLCFVVWSGYTVCLLVQTVPSLKGFMELQNSPNASKEISSQFPQITNADYLFSWMKEVLTLIYFPQYLVCLMYAFAMVSAFLDVLYLKRVRLQFVMASLNSLSSVLYYVTVGTALLSMVLCLVAIQFVQHFLADMIQLMKTYEVTGGTEIPEINDLDSFEGSLQESFQWLVAQLLFLIMMFITYSLYYCYWPHSLRIRSSKMDKFIANFNTNEDNL